MDLFCPDSSCPNHKPNALSQWFAYHGSYSSCGQQHRRYRCRSCGRTFSQRTLSIDYWTHSHIDYDELINHFASGYSLRGLSRHFHTSVKTIQDRFSRLTRTILPLLSLLQSSIALEEFLVADGIESFCVSQDFPNNLHLLVGKNSQYVYGFNYALMRRKGTMSEEQKLRCERLYPLVDFTRHTITGGFEDLTEQMNRVAVGAVLLRLYTDEKKQYRLVLAKDEQIQRRLIEGSFEHMTTSSEQKRTRTNNLFSVNYMDREMRKDVPEYHRETVCFGRNVVNSLERLCVYLYHHNFIKTYRIGVKGEHRTHAEVAGVSREEVERIRQEVVRRRRFIGDGEIMYGGFFEELWRRDIPTPLKDRHDYLPVHAVA